MTSTRSGGLGPNGHFAIRFGYPNYGTGFKILSSPSGRAATEPRKETRCVSNWQWGPKTAVETMKITLRNNALTVYIGSKSITTHNWGSTTCNLTRIIVGFMKYSGASGLVWVRAVLWEGDEPADLNSLREGSSTATTAYSVARGRTTFVASPAPRVFDLAGRQSAGSVTRSASAVLLVNTANRWAIQADATR